MDERQCRLAAVAVAVARLAEAAREAKEGLPRATGEKAEASRRPRQRCRRHGDPQRGGARSGTVLAALEREGVVAA